MFVVLVFWSSSRQLLFSFACDSLWRYLIARQTPYKILKHNDGCISEGPKGEIFFVIKQEIYIEKKKGRTDEGS